MRPRMLPFALALAAALAPLPARAQAELIMPGTRVRVMGDYSNVTGFVESVRGDTLRLQIHPGAPSVPIALQHITSLRIYERRNTARGAAKGAIWGAGIGLPVMAIDCWSDVEECRDYWGMSWNMSSERAIARAGFNGAFGGAIIGAVIGAIWPGTREIEVPLPPRAAIQLTPQGAGVSIRF